MVANQVQNIVHCHEDVQHQSQQRSVKLIRLVNFQYHLYCQKNSDNAGDNEFTSSTDIMVASQVQNIVNCHQDD